MGTCAEADLGWTEGAPGREWCLCRRRPDAGAVCLCDEAADVLHLHSGSFRVTLLCLPRIDGLLALQ